MNPISIIAPALVFGVAYYFTRDTDCELDANLTPEESELATEILRTVARPGESIEAMKDRAISLGASAGAARTQGKPKLAQCLAVHALKIAKLAAQRAGMNTRPRAPRTTFPGEKPAPFIPGPTPQKKKPSGAVPVIPVGQFGLPAKQSPSRDAKILAHVKAGRVRLPVFMPVDCSRDGIKCTVFVSDRAIALADGGKQLTVNVTHPTAERIAMALAGGGYLPTSRIADLSYQQAHVKVRPWFFPAGSKMADTLTMQKHSLAVDRRIAGRTGLIRDGGKDWVLTNKLFGRPDRSSNFGWHVSGQSEAPGIPLSKSPGGALVIEPLDLAHGIRHSDYSQVVHVVSPVAEVNGQRMDLADLLRHPTLSKTVSDEGPLKLTRHEAVTGGALVA